MAKTKTNDYEELVATRAETVLLELMFFMAMKNSFLEWLYKLFFQGQYFTYVAWLTLLDKFHETHPFVMKTGVFRGMQQMVRIQHHLPVGEGRFLTYTFYTERKYLKYFHGECVSFLARNGYLKYGTDHRFVRHVKKNILPQAKRLLTNVGVQRHEMVGTPERIIGGYQHTRFQTSYPIFLREEYGGKKWRIVIYLPSPEVAKTLMSLEEKYLILSVIHKTSLQSAMALAEQFANLKGKS